MFGLLKLSSTDLTVSMMCLSGSECGSIKRNLTTNSILKFMVDIFVIPFHDN